MDLTIHIQRAAVE